MKSEYGQPPSDEELVAALRLEQNRNLDYDRTRDLREYDFYLDLQMGSLARKYIGEKGFFKWYDMCCGNFYAGADFADTYGKIYPGQIEARGIDLDTFTPEDRITHDGARIISRGNAVIYPIPPDVDLITCVNGTYLIDKFMGFPALCQAVEHWYNSLSVGGQLALMRSPCLTGWEKPFDISQFLKQQVGDIMGNNVEIRQAERPQHPEFHDYIKVTKVNPGTVNIPKTF